MNQIKEICQFLKIRPSKRKGQNFLTNPKILEILIKAAELKKDDFILEIGPGLGILTEKLAKTVKKVMAIEVDRKLAKFLKTKFKNQKNIEIIQGDILKIQNSRLIAQRAGPKIQNYKIVANLPYSIAGAVLKKFLSEKLKPKLIVVMLQKEVAERIVAKNKKRSIISLMVNFYGQPEIVGYVSKNNFWPRPKVDGVILKISQIGVNLPKINTNLFFKIIKTGFSSPRKKLINNLSKIIKKEEIKKIFQAIGLKPEVRAENLTFKNWLEIYHSLPYK